MATAYSASPPRAFQYPPQSHNRVSSRSAYPTFLSFQVTLQLQIKWAWQGLYDSFRWIIVLRTIIRQVLVPFERKNIGRATHFLAYSDSAVRSNFYKSLFLNSLSLASIYAFDVFLQPLASRDEPKWFHRNVGWFYQVMWLLPIVGTSFYLNVSCSDFLRPSDE